MSKRTGNDNSRSQLRNSSGWLDFVLGLAASIMLAALTPSCLVAQEPEIRAELSRQRIFQGESVRYTVLLNGFGDTDKPELAAIPDIQVEPAGVTITRQTVINNFKRTSIGGPQFEYILTPQRAGEFNIPGPTAVLNGKTYRGNDVTLQVQPPNEQDLAILEASVEPQKVYPLQPFRLRLSVFVKALPDPDGDQEPLEIVRQVPVLTIPWADDKELPDGIQPESPAARWLMSMLQERTSAGFGINNIRLRSDELFSLFTEQQRAIFRPAPRRVKRKDGRGVTVDYWEYTFERELTGEKFGNYSFGPVTLKGALVSRSKSGDRYDLDEVYAVAKPIEVQIHDAPSNGRPDSYIGAIGRFEVAGELTPTDVKVGDPMTFTLLIRGTGTLQNAFPPELESLPEIAGRFKIYETTEESGERERRFIYRLRPMQENLTHFPPIDVSFFDPRIEQYRTLTTEPISIEVAKAERVSPQDIAIADQGNSKTPAPRAASGGVFANITDVRRLRDERVNPTWWLVSLGGMAATFVIATVVVRHKQRMHDSPHVDRRRAAVHRASGLLAEARGQAESGSQHAALDSVRQAISGLIGDATNSVDASLTPRDVYEQLHTAGVEESLARRTQELFEALDAARYGKNSDSVTPQIQTAARIVDELVQAFRQRKLVSG